MRITIFSIRAWLTAAVSMLQMAAAAAATLPAAGCGTATANAGMIAALPASATGYQVTTVRWDPLLKQRWAVVSSCDHPERPSFTVPIADNSIPSPAQKALLPVIHSGDVVRLLRTEPTLRITVSAVAEENGTMGSTVRVRLLRSTTPVADDLSSFAARPVIIPAIVRGPHEVEVER
jgi:hypothetical protein